MKTTGRIRINNLRMRCVVGIAEWEQNINQDVAVTMTLHMDLHPAGKSDDVADTVDYKHLKKRVMSHLENHSFALIERMAYEVAGICLEDKRVQQADVMVDKLGALRYADSVWVEVTRKRDEM
ncbi:MAG: dihydroneopterin aldolase [Deltaproteobacteria bacterium]|nr:dihydroneopterin aldolase [Deltaproteobacteria bacterium]